MARNNDDQFFGFLRRTLGGNEEETKSSTKKTSDDDQFFSFLRSTLPANVTPVAESTTPRQSEEQTTPAQTGRLRPGWSVDDVAEPEKTIFQTALDNIDKAKDEAEAAKRFDGMTTEELFSYVPTTQRDKYLYETYMDSRTRAGESLTRQSKRAENDAARAGNEAEAYREFLGMPGASDEEIFGLAQAIRANNAQARSLEPQKWLEYAEGLKESQARKDSLTEKGRELGSRATAANEQGQVWEYSNLIGDYGELINSPDYATKSQYVAPKETAVDIWKKDKNDPRLRYMAANGDRDAQTLLQHNAQNDSQSYSLDGSYSYGVGNFYDLGGDNDYLFELTDTEKSVYNALYASSPEAADNFLDKLKPYLEVRARDTYTKRMAELANEAPGAMSVVSVGANIPQSLEYAVQLGELLSDGKINQNNPAYRASQMSNTIRGEVSKIAEEQWGKAGSAAYNLGMSFADFLTTTALSGGSKALSLGLMGTRVAANTVLNLKDRGYDDTAAFTLGTIAGAAEIVTESFSLETILNPDLLADGIARYLVKSFFAEASEEGASNLINLAAENIYDAITGNNEAEWKQQIYDAIQNGADPNDAVLAAIQNNLVQLGTDVLSGGISGFLMAGAATPIHVNNFNASQQGQYANAIRGNEEDLQALIQRGLESPQNTESYQLAQAALKQFADGKTPSTLTVSRLVEANQQQAENEAAEQSGQGRFRLTLPRTVETQDATQATPAETASPADTMPDTNGAETNTAQVSALSAVQETQTNRTGGRSDAEKAAALQRAYEAERNIVEQQSPERQRFLKRAYSMIEDELKSLAVGDRLVDENGNTIATVVSTGNGGITLVGDDYMERIPDGTFGNSSAIANDLVDGKEYRLWHFEKASQEPAPVPQETRNAPRLTLPTRDTQTPQQATETPRLTLPATQTDDQISAFGDQEETVARAAQAESDLVTKLRASKPGLLIDDYAANNIDETQRRAIDETAKRLGLRVAFSDTVSVGQDNAKIYDDGVVLIEKNNQNPVGFLYGHEMGHWLQQNSPDAYKEFAEAARATDPEWFKAREEATAAAYRDAGIEISPERIQEEVLSDYAGWLVQNEDVLNRFIEQNKDKPNVLRRLYEAIKALAAKLTGREKQQADTAADLLLRAMNATEANVQNGIMSTGETRGSFGEANALHADQPANMSKSSVKGLNADTAPVSIQRNDENYTAALDDGDIAKAAQIVHETADSAMPDSKVRNASTGELRHVYHYTNKNFYEFRPMGQSAGSNRTLGDGYYVSTSETEFKSFGKNKMTLFANITNPFEMELTEEQAQAVYDKYFRPHHEDRFHTYEPHVVGKLQSYSQVFDYLKEAAEKNGTTTSAILSELGFDGVHSGPEWVAFYPEQLKSADVATYNDDGQLIPLSERFNPDNPDTRYSLKGLNADIAPESIQKYGQIPKGEKPARDINVPRKVTDKADERVSWTARTALEAKATPDAAIPGIAELVEKGAFSYKVQTDKAAIENAEATIKDKGWSASLADWMKDVTAGKVNKANTAMGWALYNNAANAGDLDTALNVLDLMVRHQRNAAQALQASRILKQLSPEAQLYGVQRSVDNLVKELQERYGKRKNIDIKINRDLAQAFLDAKTEEERQKALKALYKDIGRQIPATFLDKWNAWRYLAMLGNPRTHVRNVAGNTGFAPVVLAKDQVATALESIASAVSKGKVERTKGLVLPVRDHDLVKAAWDRYQSVRDQALGEGKYNDSQMANKWIEEGRTIFKFKPLELARRGNSAALDVEDVWFSQPHYTYALAQYCKANGITPAQIRSGEGTDKADAYAIKEAQKATYRDTNAFSSFVSSLGRAADRKSGVGKAASAVLEGVLPFRKTPANILVRGLEYSPVGLLKSLTYDLAQVMRTDADGNPRMSVAEMLDDVSEGLTGTGLLALGALLVKLGLLRGRGEDEKKVRDFYDLMGYQNYALTLPNGKSYTLDWLAPESLPLFVGANIYEKLQQNKGDMKMSDIIDVISQISEPMLEMSMLQSLNDMFESIGYAKENELSGLTQILSSAATSYLTQAIPTLLGQGERTGEKLRMTTYTDKNKWLTKSMQYTLGKISAKIPGWDYDQIPYIDAWGRTEVTGDGWVDRAVKNMVNPAYTDQTRMSDMEAELLRLYNVDPDKYGSVLPTSHKASKYLTHDKERIDLTGEQYVAYATTKGQMAYDLITELTESDAYKNASDEDKAKMADAAYDYAATVAKGELLESLGKTYEDYDKLKDRLDKGADIMDMIVLAQEIKNADAENNANSSYDTLEILSAFAALNLPEAKAEPLMEQKLSESQWEKYNTLKDAGVNYDTRLDIMRKYSELNANDEMKPGDKALEFSRYVDGLRLTGSQNQLVKSTYKFGSMVPAEATRYETFKASGMNEDKAKHTSEILSALEPLPGKEAVTDLQRYRAIAADKELTDKEKLIAIGSIMGTELKTEKGNSTQWAKFNLALNNGQSLSQAIDLCENGRLDEFEKWTESAAKGQKVTWDVYDTFLKETADLAGDKDANGKTISGSLKKKVAAYIDSLDLTPEQKDALLTDYNSTYKHDVTWHSGSYGSGKAYAKANLSRLELPRTTTTRQGRLTLSRR